MSTSSSVDKKTNPDHKQGEYGILVESIGTAGVSLLPALKKVSPLSENKIAALLFQTPSLLLSGLPEEGAQEINKLLLSTGLKCRVVPTDEQFEPGDKDHEIALVINSFENIHEIVREIISVTGMGIDQIRQLLLKSPTVLLGQISQNTVAALQQRFEALGVEVDISRPEKAQFDVFKGPCSPFEQNMLEQILRPLKIEWNPEASEHPEKPNLLCSGISRKQADQLWAQTSRTGLPIQIVNRDFERYDLCLDKAPDSPEMIQYLISSTGMPEKIAPKVLQKLPIILQKNIHFAQVEAEMEKLRKLGATASAHLLAFQTFALKVESVKHIKHALDVLEAVGGVDPAVAKQALQKDGLLEGPFTNPQARWLQHELKKIGTLTKRILK